MPCNVLIDSEAVRGPNEYEQTTPAELEVFDLEPELVEAMRDAYWRYMDYLELIMPPFDGAQAEKDQKEHPGYIAGQNGERPVFENSIAAQFMSDVAGLPYEQAFRFCIKVELAQWRMGLLNVHKPPIPPARTKQN